MLPTIDEKMGEGGWRRKMYTQFWSTRIFIGFFIDKINDESWLDTKNFLQCNVMVPYYFPKNLLEIADNKKTNTWFYKIS